MTEWLCPATESVELLNHPETYTNGKDFRLIVDFCGDEPTCLSDGDKTSFLKHISINSKVIHQ